MSAARRLLGVAACLAVVSVAAAGCGAGDADIAPSKASPARTLGGVAAGAVDVEPLGDVDGDGRLDVAVSGAERWLALSGRTGLVELQGLGEPSAGPSPARTVIPLGDADGDGRADLAVASDRGRLVVLYGRRTWPSGVDASAGAGGQAGVVAGEVRGGRPHDVAARDGRTLLVPLRCVDEPDGCSRVTAWRVPVPARGATVHLEEGTAVPAPALPSGSGDRVLDSIPPWGSGARAVAAWLIRLHGSRGIGEPEVVSGGRGPWRLGANALLLGAGERAALIATQSDPPPGEAVQAALVLHRLDAGGRTKRLALTGEADANGVDGTLAPAGRCVVVGGWTGVDAPAVWVVNLSAMAVRARWTFPGAALATGATLGGHVDLVAVGTTGRLSLARGDLPAACRAG